MTIVVHLLFIINFAGIVVAAQTLTVRPKEDPQAVLHNPDMGWVLYENYPIDADPHGSSTMLELPKETFPDVDAVAVMFTWADVEKTADQYDFAKVDYAYDYWSKRGKAIQLRMSADTVLWWNTRNPPAGLGVPAYVLNKLPADKKQVRNCEGIAYTVVDAREPYYLDRLGKFLGAVEKHYGKSRPVSLIDLRGFGLWGEWHTGYKYPSVEDRHAALCGVIDCWSKHLPTHRLALSYSYDPDSPKSYYAGPYNHFDPKFTSAYADYVHFSAFDCALKYPNVTFRRDGAGGAVHSNERRFIEAAFAMGKGPFMCEYAGGFGDAKKGHAGWLDWVVSDAFTLHPNYVALLGWQGGDALAFIRERRDLVEKGLRTMGYRLVPTAVEFSRSVPRDGKLSLRSEWINRGVGRTVQNYSLLLVLKDDEGEIREIDAGKMPTHEWVSGKTYSYRADVNFAGVPSGEYEMGFAVVDDDKKRIALPIADGEDKGYSVGKILVK